MSAVDAVPYINMCEDYSRRVAELESALADVLPYAIACIGLPRPSWPADSVILRAEALLGVRS